MAKKITEAQEKRYVRRNGVGCPFCGACEVQSGKPELMDNGIEVPVECLSCREKWTDVYKLAGIVEADEPKKT